MGSRRSLTFIGTAAAALLLLAGCSPASSEADPTPTPSATAEDVETTPAPTPSETQAAPTPEPVAATCENTVSAEAAASFAAYNWTVRPSEDPWVLGGGELTGGVQCLWGDYSIATDNVSWLGWAPIEQAQAEAAINELVASGEWRREDAAEGIYVTAEGADMLPVIDDQGYATTYLFADGQVKFAGTKSEIAIIIAPPGFAP